MTIVDRAVRAAARTSVFDGVAARLSVGLSYVTHKHPLSTLLAGTWLGHPVHPVLTDVPIGCWTSAVVLDLTGSRARHDAARRLVGAGVLAAIPTAMTGLADWADTGDETRRIGTVHSLLNLTGAALFGLSWLARRHDRHVRGVALSLAGTALVTAGAALGGHLVYRTGTGVDWTVFDERPADWTAPEGAPQPLGGGTSVLTVGPGKVLATKLEDGVWAGMDARCSHRGGPLDEGTIEHGCVTCPWHHSRFRLDGGSIVHGPATAPQPRYDVEERDGTLVARAAARPA
jgi:nitrite reductase/ring-hydroxylating ferredoxin subunit/uncharacterized membrane protein